LTKITTAALLLLRMSRVDMQERDEALTPNESVFETHGRLGQNRLTRRPHWILKCDSNSHREKIDCFFVQDDMRCKKVLALLI